MTFLSAVLILAAIVGVPILVLFLITKAVAAALHFRVRKAVVEIAVKSFRRLGKAVRCKDPHLLGILTMDADDAIVHATICKDAEYLVKLISDLHLEGTVSTDGMAVSTQILNRCTRGHEVLGLANQKKLVAHLADWPSTEDPSLLDQFNWREAMQCEV